MAFPSIVPLRTSSFEQRATADAMLTANGTPLILERSTGRKYNFDLEYVLTTAQWSALITHFEANHSTAFSWTDDRTATSRTVRYRARPAESRTSSSGVLQSTHRAAYVRLMEV